MIEELARIPTEVEYASEFRYRNPIVDEGTLVIAISQSGETADTLAALLEAKQRGARTMGLVNVVGSTIAREVDGGLYLRCRPRGRRRQHQGVHVAGGRAGDGDDSLRAAQAHVAARGASLRRGADEAAGPGARRSSPVPRRCASWPSASPRRPTPSTSAAGSTSRRRSRGRSR
ncbi:MAG: SIS domain-containing protein [Gemmatimonadales bacterium]